MSKIKRTRGRIDEASVLEEKIVMEKAWGEFETRDMQNKKTPWEMVFFVLGLDRFFYRLKLLRWLIKSLPNAFRGCEESPVPGPLLERKKWYKKRAWGYIYYKNWWWFIIIRTKISLGRDEWKMLLELVFDRVYLSSKERTTKVRPPKNMDSNLLVFDKEPNGI